MKELLFTGSLNKDYTISLDNIRHYKHVLKDSRDSGETLEIRIAKHYSKRSLQQNRWLWGVAYVTIREFLFETQGQRYTLQEIHNWNLRVVQGQKLTKVTIKGKSFLMTKDVKSSEWNTREFNEAKEKLQVYCSEEWGLVIADPHEVL